MNARELSRRTILVAGGYAFGATALVSKLASAHAETESSANSQQIIRKYYKAWENKDWELLDSLLTDSFTFSSAAGDDHISKAAFKTQCWDTQSPYIERFGLVRVLAVGSDAFVMYVCHMKGGKSFRNVEYLRFEEDKVASIECYFGATAGYPTA